jgi:hypothetical protein
MWLKMSCISYRWQSLYQVPILLQVSDALRADRRSPEDCEQLFKKHKSFLSMASGPEMGKAFVAIVNDGYNADLNGTKADEAPMSQETVSTAAAKGASDVIRPI